MEGDEQKRGVMAKPEDLGCKLSEKLQFCQNDFNQGGCISIFVAHETIGLNISWPSNFFRKYFMVPSINFNFLFKAYL